MEEKSKENIIRRELRETVSDKKLEEGVE